MNRTEANAMRDALDDLTPQETRTLISYMEACEPETFAAAYAYTTGRRGGAR